MSNTQETPATAPTSSLPRPELLAPAGDRDCLRAAVENGADAVYFGLDSGFNARARAANFRLVELPDVMDFLRHRGLKGYVALNTLVFSSELERLEETVRQVAAAGADAVMVQDLGVARLIRQVCPDLPMHASTQMTLTSAECLAMVESFGFERVVMPRELSIREIAKIHAQTRIGLEAFVHGALCVAYSGQCLTSESLGGRSANRGQCAQACRTPYELVLDGEKGDRHLLPRPTFGWCPPSGCFAQKVPAPLFPDGKTLDLGQQKYLLSPQDLAAYDLLPALLVAGVSALKIEGRLKTAEYVANITRNYRTAIETALAGRPVEFTPRQVEEMEVSFSRGFSHGWLQGCDHKALVPGLSSTKRGVLLGEVRAVGRDRVQIELACPLRRGDGLVFEGDRSQKAEAGGRVYEIFQQGRSMAETVQSGRVELTFAHGSIDFHQLYPGQKAWKTDDPQLTRRLRQTYSGPDPQCRVPLNLAIEARVGSPLEITGRAASGAACRIVSDAPLEEARKHPLSKSLLREQLGRLGGTSYELATLEAAIEGRPMVPLSVLGKLRHAMVESLDASLARPPQRPLAPGSVLAALRATLPANVARASCPCDTEDTDKMPVPHVGRIANPSGGRPDLLDGLAIRPTGEPARVLSPIPRLHVLCRSLVQLEAVLACGVRSVMVDFQDIRQYAAAVEAAHRSAAAILLATPRIQKPGELGIFRVLMRHGADGILVRNLAGLGYYVQQRVPVVADFSLNATNELTAQWLIDRGAARVTASYDMNRDQLLEMAAAVPPEWLEVVIHQHMPMFHMEHCVFCAVLSPGHDKTDCGRPCDRHQVQLRDRIGKEHPLRADVGCRNTLYNATPQSAAEAIPQLIAQGLRDFRIELVDGADPVRPAEVIGLYRDLLAGQVTGREVWSRLRASNRVGVTRGTLEERRNPDAIL
jgi:putative protease